jgi:hypothetical protein
MSFGSPKGTKKSNKMCVTDTINKRGQKLCHAMGCRKYKHLEEKFGGLFCPKHTEELQLIRNKLWKAKSSGNIIDQVYYRQEEIEFRKLADPGHMFFQRNLEKFVGI